MLEQFKEQKPVKVKPKKETAKEKKARILKTEIKDEPIKGIHYLITKDDKEIRSSKADIYIKTSLLGLSTLVVDQLIEKPYCHHNNWYIKLVAS